MNVQTYVKGCLTTSEDKVQTFFSKSPRLPLAHHTIQLTKQGTTDTMLGVRGRGVPYEGTHHVIIPPRMRAAGHVLMVGLKRLRKDYRQRQRSLAFYNKFISQDLDNSAVKTEGFG